MRRSINIASVESSDNDRYAPFLLVFIGVCWCLLVFVGVSWCFLVFLGISWCLSLLFVMYVIYALELLNISVGTHLLLLLGSTVNPSSRTTAKSANTRT